MITASQIMGLFLFNWHTPPDDLVDSRLIRDAEVRGKTTQPMDLREHVPLEGFQAAAHPPDADARPAEPLAVSERWCRIELTRRQWQ